MPAFTIVSPEELAERQQKPSSGGGRPGRRRSDERTRIIEEYKVMLRDVHLGFGVDVVLTPEEAKPIVRENLKAAAAELDRALAFRRIKNPSRLQFRIITPEEYAAMPKRGGRRPKNAHPVSRDAEQPPFALVEDHDA